MKKSIFSIQTVDRVAVITLDTPGEKVNKLNEALMNEFTSFIDSFEKDDSLDGALLISGKEGNFIAGADIEMFKTRETAEELEQLSLDGHEILLRIENLKKPVFFA